MKTLIESLFDTDLVEKNIYINIKTAFDIITQHISKKQHIKLLEPRDANFKKYKEGKLFYYSKLSSRNYDIIFLDYCSYNKALENIGIGIDIELESDFSTKSCFFKAINVGWSVADKTCLSPIWYTLWRGDGYKKFTNLKTNIIDSNSLPDILAYIEWLCKKIVIISERDKDEIHAIANGVAWGAEDNPIMMGKKDVIWYINKIKKELS